MKTEKRNPRNLTYGDLADLKELTLKLAETRHPEEIRPMVEAVSEMLEELNGYSTSFKPSAPKQKRRPTWSSTN
ncbi:TPA: hypothetical protein ACLBBX_000113 [Neisseria meningitidis]